MNKLYKSLVLLVLSVWGLMSYAAFTPTNLTQAKDQVKEYYESGQHAIELSEILQRAKDVLYRSAWYNKKIKEPRKLAIVYDIDDAALNNYSIMKKYNFADTEEVWDVIQKSTDIPANEVALELYNEARELNVSVFFITARLEKYRDTTKKAIENAGYTNYQGLYLISEKYEKLPFGDFKADVRREITENGYHIVLNIGDQYSDLVGGYSDYVYKLPNYMYGSY